MLLDDFEGQKFIAPMDLAEAGTRLDRTTLSAFDEGDFRLLLALNELLPRLGDASVMVRSDHFEDYARDYVNGLCDIPDFVESHINWGDLASGLQQDYQEIEFLGQTYLYR